MPKLLCLSFFARLTGTLRNRDQVSPVSGVLWLLPLCGGCWCLPAHAQSNLGSVYLSTPYCQKATASFSITYSSSTAAYSNSGSLLPGGGICVLSTASPTVQETLANAGAFAIYSTELPASNWVVGDVPYPGSIAPVITELNVYGASVPGGIDASLGLNWDDLGDGAEVFCVSPQAATSGDPSYGPVQDQWTQNGSRYTFTLTGQCGDLYTDIAYINGKLVGTEIDNEVGNLTLTVSLEVLPRPAPRIRPGTVGSIPEESSIPAAV
jgi:hypothetical protein